jgi:PTS system nitrogen regulatory IIA component
MLRDSDGLAPKFGLVGALHQAFDGDPSMSRLTRLLSPDNVVVDLAVTSKKRLFEQMGLLFENLHGIERSRVFDSLFARERLGSTGLGEGVAIPHGRIKGLREARAAVVRLSTPIAFDAPDGKPVNLLIVLLVPEHATDEHLEILSEVAELLSDPAMRQMLMHEPQSTRIHDQLMVWEPCRPAA